MANLSNINNILRISSSGVGLNKDNTGPSELDIESAGADMIDMTRTGQKTYRFAISGASAFSLFDVAANADRLVINSAGNATFAGSITAPTLSIQNQINTTSSNLEMNYANGDGTTTNFKDFYIRDGKNAVILNIQGSSKNATFSGDVLIRGTNNPYASANRANITLNGSAGNIIAFTNNTSGKGYIYHDNTDLKILNAIAGDLIFYTNSTERLRINSSGNSTFAGNVDVGTTSTKIQLKTNADIFTAQTGSWQISGTIANVSYPNYGFYGNTGVGMYRPAVDSLGFVTNSVERLRINSSGNSTFAGNVDINGRNVIEYTTSATNTTVEALIIKGLTSGTATNGFGVAMSFYNENSVYSAVNQVGKIEVIETNTTAINDKMVFSVKDNNILAERLTLDGSGATFAGNITIKNPTTSNLQLQSDQTTWVQNDVISNLNTYVSDTSAAGARDVAAIKVVNDQVGTNTTMSGVMTFYTSAYNAQMFERMRINGLGNVGIGETSVDARLHISALASNGISNVKLESPGASKWAFGIPAGQTYFALDDVNDNLTTPRLVVLKTSGNVGIGTTTPGKKLEVAGSYKLGTNAYIQYDAGYPYTINMLNTASVGNLILNAGAGSSGYESKIELQGGNTAGGASITFTTASSQALVIKNGGDLTVSGSIIDANGVRTYRNGGSMNNGVAYTFDITVPNDSGSGTIHHVDAMMTHYDTQYGCLLNCYAYTRGTAVSTQTNLVNQTSTQGGGWFVTKPNSTTLRITKTAGTYVGTGFFQIVVITKST